MKERMEFRVMVRLPDRVADEVQRLADRETVSLSTKVRQLVLRGLEQYEREQEPKAHLTAVK